MTPVCWPSSGAGLRIVAGVSKWRTWDLPPPAERRIVLPVGVSPGDVLVDDEDLWETVLTWRPNWNSVAQQVASASQS
jgi:hypothetical protein